MTTSGMHRHPFEGRHIVFIPWPQNKYINDNFTWIISLNARKTELALKVLGIVFGLQITLPDGSTRAGESWRSTPYSIAANISQGLAESTVVAKVDGEVWDLDKPLTRDCKLKLLKFDDDEAKAVSTYF